LKKIKSQLESNSAAKETKNRKTLNDQISQGLKDLENLKQELIKTISPDEMLSKIGQNKLAIDLSEELIDLVNPDMEPSLVAETVRVREKLADELGYIIPKILFEDDDNLGEYEFSIKIRGLEVVTSAAYPEHLMYFKDELNLTKKIADAIYTTDEITGKQIIWVKENKTKNFWQKGLTPSDFITRMLEFTVKKHVDDLLDYQDMNNYIEVVSEKNMFLIENIIPEFVSIAELRYLFVNLIREGVSIKDIIYIFEKINDYSDELAKEDLLDKIRLSMSKFITKSSINSEGTISAFSFSDNTFEQLFGDVDSEETIVRIDGSKIDKIVDKLIKKVKAENIDFDKIIIVTPIEVRHMTFMILSQFIPNLKVIAREEITNEYNLEIISEI
jgi:flagellar biosynthesis protein FlhA